MILGVEAGAPSDEFGSQFCSQNRALEIPSNMQDVLKIEEDGGEI